MRIISGTARGLKLTTFSGKGIRPTPDRVREALFSSLNSRLGSFTGLRVLELFAGSGAQSLEALSRGAAAAVLVDASPQAARVIGDNIERCRMADRTRLVRGDALATLPRLQTEVPFDLILLDPPYHCGLIPQVLEKIDALQLLADDGIICAEAASDEQLASIGRLQLQDSRRYGSTTLHFFGWQQPDGD